MSVSTQHPSRDFGYFAGDLVTANATIEADRQTTLVPGSLPPIGPVSASLDIHGVEVTQQNKAGVRRLTIRVTYQTFYTPLEPEQLKVPGYSVDIIRRNQRLTLAIPGFSIAVSPFRHDLTPSIDVNLIRPDPPMPSMPGAGQALALKIGVAGAGLGFAGLFLARARRRPRGPRQFAAALRQLRQIRAPDQSAAVAGFRLLHRAFDATAGRRILSEDIGIFLERHPAFLPLQDDIRSFFSTSRQVFFAAAAVTPPAASLLPLARRLAQAERAG